MDEDIETHREDWRDRQSGAESQQREEGVQASCDVELLNNLFGQNCTLEADGSSAADSEMDRQRVNVADEPSDGGDDRKRHAAPSQQNTAERTGNNCVCVSVNYQYIIIHFGKNCHVFQTLFHI